MGCGVRGSERWLLYCAKCSRARCRRASQGQAVMDKETRTADKRAQADNRTSKTNLEDEIPFL